MLRILYQVSILLLTISFCGVNARASAIPYTDSLTRNLIRVQRVDSSIKVDGILDETMWSQVPYGSGFTQLDPNPGVPSGFRTEIRVLYDDNAIYIGATLFDDNPEGILKELSPRDQLANTDYFSVVIDTYKAGQTGFGFTVTPSGVQVDQRITNPSITDPTWDAVWISAVNIHENGWTVEIEIPYSALRFPPLAEQAWGINFGRYVRRVREESWWNEINPAISNTLFQTGRTSTIENVKPLPRISLIPFVSTYIENNSANPGVWRKTINGGMDLKLGIGDAFTLDMALIPDFGQVRFDDQVLNLSPFEIRFEENRPFFTEGTELFNRAGLFYSRRMGAQPFYLSQWSQRYPQGTSIENVPANSQLLNAVKFSGRTSSGLGIGVLNAIENRGFATINISETGQEKVVIHPLTNYNVSVLDQNLPYNSYVSLINTNVWREGDAYEANVTGTEFGLRTKNNKYLLSGNAAISQRYLEEAPQIGYNWKLNWSKTRGSWQYTVSATEISPDYNPNDLGFNLIRNYRGTVGTLNYYKFIPGSIFNRYNSSLSVAYERIIDPNAFHNFQIRYNSFFMTRKFFAFGINALAEPVITYDFFEPRDNFQSALTYPRNGQIGGFISTDYRKKFAIDISWSSRWFQDEDRSTHFFEISPRFRLNDHFFFTIDHFQQWLHKDVGYSSKNPGSVGYESLQPDDILFSRRNQHIITNTLSARYNFNALHNITLRTRHYFTSVDFIRFHILDDEGLLGPTEYTGRNSNGDLLHSQTVNLLTTDLVYTWRFAPGSDIILVWKHALNLSQNQLDISYFDFLNNIFEYPQANSLSLRVVYYLDYGLVKRRFSKAS
jgi:hypothetical protein